MLSRREPCPRTKLWWWVTELAQLQVPSFFTAAVPGQPPWDSEVARHDPAASQGISGKAVFTGDLYLSFKLIILETPRHYCTSVMIGHDPFLDKKQAGITCIDMPSPCTGAMWVQDGAPRPLTSHSTHLAWSSASMLRCGARLYTGARAKVTSIACLTVPYRIFDSQDLIST